MTNFATTQVNSTFFAISITFKSDHFRAFLSFNFFKPQKYPLLKYIFCCRKDFVLHSSPYNITRLYLLLLSLLLFAQIQIKVYIHICIYNEDTSLVYDHFTSKLQRMIWKKSHGDKVVLWIIVMVTISYQLSFSQFMIFPYHSKLKTNEAKSHWHSWNQLELSKCSLVSETRCDGWAQTCSYCSHPQCSQEAVSNNVYNSSTMQLQSVHQ